LQLLLFTFGLSVIASSSCHFRSSGGGGGGGGSGDGGVGRDGGGGGTRCEVFTVLLLKSSHFWNISSLIY